MKTLTALALLIACLAMLPASGAVSTGKFGPLDVQAATIDMTWERAILTGASPKITWADKKGASALEAPNITVYRLGAGSERELKDAPERYRVEMRGGGCKITSTEHGIVLEAAEITVVVLRGKAGTSVQSALATGRPHFVQSDKDTHADAAADTLELKDDGDTAVLTGNVAISMSSPAYDSAMQGDLATVTNLQPKNGQPANPHIVMESKDRPSQLSATQKESAAKEPKKSK